MSFKALTLILILVSTAAAAQEHRYSWRDLVSHTLEKNESIAATQSKAKSEKFKRYQLVAEFLPSIDYIQTEFKQESSAQIDTQSDRVWEKGFEVKLNIFNGFSSTNKYRGQLINEQLSDVSSQKNSNEVLNSVRASYFEYLIAKEKLKLVKKINSRQKENARFIRLKYKSGAEALWSWKNAQTELKKSRQNLISEQNNVSQLKRDLISLSNIQSDEKLDFIGSSSSYLRPMVITSKFDELPDYKAALLNEKLSQKELNRSKSSFLPQVDLAYSETQVKTKLLNTLEGTADTKEYGIRLTWNLFSGFSTFNDVRKAMALKYASKKERIYLEKNLKRSIAKAVKAYQLSLSQWPIAKETLSVARLRAKTVTKQYRLGLKKFLDWEQAQVKLIEAEFDEVEVKRKALNARAKLELIISYDYTTGDES